MTGRVRSAGVWARGRRIRSNLRQGLHSYSRMLAYVHPYWRRLTLAAISLVLVSLLGLVMPLAVSSLVDLVVNSQDMAQLNRIALILVVIFVLRSAFSFVYIYLVAWVGERVVANLRAIGASELQSAQRKFKWAMKDDLAPSLDR